MLRWGLSFNLFDFLVAFWEGRDSANILEASNQTLSQGYRRVYLKISLNIKWLLPRREYFFEGQLGYYPPSFHFSFYSLNQLIHHIYLNICDRFVTKEMIVVFSKLLRRKKFLYKTWAHFFHIVIQELRIFLDLICRTIKIKLASKVNKFDIIIIFILPIFFETSPYDKFNHLFFSFGALKFNIKVLLEDNKSRGLSIVPSILDDVGIISRPYDKVIPGNHELPLFLSSQLDSLSCL